MQLTPVINLRLQNVFWVLEHVKTLNTAWVPNEWLSCLKMWSYYGNNLKLRLTLS